MRNLFTFSFLVLFIFSATAQKQLTRAIDVEARSSSDVHMQHMEILNNRFEIVNDTLFPEIFGADDCSLSENWTIYGSQDADMNTVGYVTGNNNYGDLEKGELLSVEEGVASINVSAVYMIPLFGLNMQDSEISAKIYAYNPADSLPGDLLGVSESLRIEDLNEVGDNFFNFTPAVEVTGDKFFAVIDFSDTYSGSDLKDTIGVVSTEFGCGSPTNTVELWNDDTWHFLPAAWSQASVSMLVGAAVEYDNATSGFVTPGRNGVELMPAFPNPAKDQVSMAYTLGDGSNAMFRVVDALGREITTQHLGFIQAGTHVHDMDISKLGSGIYFYTLHTDKAVLSGSFMKR